MCVFLSFLPHIKNTSTNTHRDPEQQLKMAITKRKLTFNKSSSTTVLQFDFKSGFGANHTQTCTHTPTLLMNWLIYTYKNKLHEEAPTWQNFHKQLLFPKHRSDRSVSACCLWRLGGTWLNFWGSGGNLIHSSFVLLAYTQCSWRHTICVVMNVQGITTGKKQSRNLIRSKAAYHWHDSAICE